MLVITPVKSDIRVTYRINVEPALIDGAHYPNVTDPATRGGLLHLIREVCGDPSVGIYAIDVFNQRQWICEGSAGVLSRAATEAEALVFALEAAYSNMPSERSEPQNKVWDGPEQPREV
jgi:hypothetical protein